MINRKSFYETLQQDELYNKPIREKEEELQKLNENNIHLETQIKENKHIINGQDKFIADLRVGFEKEVEQEREGLLDKAKIEAERIVEEANQSLTEVLKKTMDYQTEIETLSEEHSKLTKEVNRYTNQARKFKAEVTGLKNFSSRFPHTINFDDVNNQLEELEKELDEDTLLGTIIRLHLHSDHSKELRKLSNATKREIKNLLRKYEDRYTTKANKTIYNLMIIGLQAEVQILLLQLKYNKLDESEEAVNNIITKYLSICATGNKAILPTITKFLTEIEPLYKELIQIEYKYYVYREQEKEEQKMIKEQMRQEAEEKKKLAEEKKKLDVEERKFNVEMERHKNLLEQETDSERIKQLQDRLAELQIQVKEIDDKKEEIASLTLGKAGYVYIISNKGSFGEQMFKIGMTRRVNPQDRVDELGSASVPFKFDVHAMIFSDDAVGLENKLHKLLNEQRVNKVNYRKEFFYTTIEDLKERVEDIDPTVEFVTTMLAQEYNQTLAIKESSLVS
ncbi:GIY-YIG nuclease family protein [Virgibacillus sp. MSJ-26]|nr:GIY-YIG nuclease family protein [Virgibacillus sp. MSJ-26]